MVCRVAVLAGLLAAVPAFAQVAAPKTAPPPKLTFAQIGLFIYPAKEQTPDQQKKDEDACYEWAEANTGLTLVAGSVDAEAAGKAAAKDAGQGKVVGRRGRRGRNRTGDRGDRRRRRQGRGDWRRGGLGWRRAQPHQSQAGGWPERCPAGRPGEPTGRGPVQESGGGVSRGARLLSQMTGISNRRGFLTTMIGACAIAPAISASAQTGTSGLGSLTKEQRDRMTPGQVLDTLRQGNERFRTGKMVSRDYRDQQRTSAAGQFPAAVVLGCIDSRAPAEIIFDTGIGDTFNARIAGNVVNDDLLGSLEFACAVAGAKVLLLFGHTACGAIKGAIDDVEMGNLTGLLARVKPAITATAFDGVKSSKNAAYVDAVARTNVLLGLDNIRRRSPILAELGKEESHSDGRRDVRPRHGRRGIRD